MAIITPSDVSPPTQSPQQGYDSSQPRQPTTTASLPNPVWRYALYAALAVGLYFAYPALRTGYENVVGGKKDDGNKGPPPAIPVGTAIARSGEMEIYLTGLGTATPLKTVTIRSRVDGELTKVLFQEGDLVEEGKLLAQIDPRPYQIVLEQAQAQMLKDEATLANARAIQARNLSLMKGAIATQELETQATVIKELEALVKTDQARVDDANLNVKFCDIKAPCNGRIGLRNIDQGNMIRANETQGLAVITQLTPITVIFAIPQDSINRVQKQINAGKSLAVDAFDRGLKTKLASGTLLAIDNQVDPTTGTVRLKARFENQDQLLYPNQFVNVRLLLETRRETILVPAAAVQTGPTSDFVYVVIKHKEEETVALRPIQQGPSEGDLTAIEAGLAAEEIVVIDGIDKLKPGSKVTTRKPGDGKQSGEGQGKQPPAKEAS